MALGIVEPQGIFHAPLSEKLTDELLYAVKNDRADSAACREELNDRGWTDAHIEAFIK